MKEFLKTIERKDTDLFHILLPRYEPILRSNDKDLWNSLKITIKYGRTEMMKPLLSFVTDINAKDDNGDTLLHIATGYNDYNRDNTPFKILIDRGANVDLKNKRGRTPLFIAAGNNNKVLMKILIENGADRYSVDNEGNTILHASVPIREKYHGSKQWKASKLLLDEFNIEKTNNRGETILHIVSQISPPKLIEILLNLKANIEAKDINGCTPLHLAAGNSICFYNMKALIHGGANLETKNNTEKTALSIAIGKGCNERGVIFLIDHGAEVSNLTINEKSIFEKILKIYRTNPLKFLKDNDADDDWIRKSLIKNIELFKNRELCRSTWEILEYDKYTYSEGIKKHIEDAIYFYMNDNIIEFLEYNKYDNNSILRKIENSERFDNIEKCINYINSEDCKYSDRTKDRLLNTLGIFKHENFIKYLEDRNLPESEIIRLSKLRRNSDFFSSNMENTIKAIKHINSDDCKLSIDTRRTLFYLIKIECPNAFIDITESINSHVEKIGQSRYKNNNEHNRG